MPDRLQVGTFTILFDEQGATIKTAMAEECYRVDGPTATNLHAFLKHHASLCRALSSKHSKRFLQPYRLQ